MRTLKSNSVHSHTMRFFTRFTTIPCDYLMLNSHNMIVDLTQHDKNRV